MSQTKSHIFCYPATISILPAAHVRTKAVQSHLWFLSSQPISGVLANLHSPFKHIQIILQRFLTSLKGKNDLHHLVFSCLLGLTYLLPTSSPLLPVLKLYTLLICMHYIPNILLVVSQHLPLLFPSPDILTPKLPYSLLVFVQMTPSQALTPFKIASLPYHHHLPSTFSLALATL